MRIVVVSAALLVAAPVASAQPARAVTGPRTLTPAYVACTDLPAAARPQPTLIVRGGHNVDGHYSLTKGETLILSRTADDGLAVGQRYIARRPWLTGPRFPAVGEAFGAIRNAGWVTITAVDELNALAVIDFVCDGIEPGDYLEPYAEVVLPATAAPMGEPRFEERANILFGTDRRAAFGDGDTFSIDRGSADGVVSGARFAIFRDRRNGMPLINVGEAVVMELGERTSKVVLVSVTDIVEVGDIAIPRR